MQLGKRDKAYKVQAHCLACMFTGLHEMYHFMVPFTRLSLSSENELLYGRIVVCISQEQLGYFTKLIIH